MDEKTNTTPKEYKGPDDRYEESAMAARAARRIFTPGRVLAGAAIAGGTLLLAPQITHAIDQSNEAASLTASEKHDAAVIKEIQDKATGKVDPADVKRLFEVKTPGTLYSLSVDLVDSQPEFQAADDKTKKWIDRTVTVSTEAQGPYDVGDPFVISKVIIDGRETFIIQDGKKYQLPDVGPPASDNLLASPITH